MTKNTCPLGHTSTTKQIVVSETVFGDLHSYPRFLEICAVCGVVFDSRKGH
jgi:hypothetical protein